MYVVTTPTVFSRHGRCAHMYRKDVHKYRPTEEKDFYNQSKYNNTYLMTFLNTEQLG